MIVTRRRSAAAAAAVVSTKTDGKAHQPSTTTLATSAAAAELPREAPARRTRTRRGQHQQQNGEPTAQDQATKEAVAAAAAVVPPAAGKTQRRQERGQQDPIKMQRLREIEALREQQLQIQRKIPSAFLFGGLASSNSDGSAELLSMTMKGAAAAAAATEYGVQRAGRSTRQNEHDKNQVQEQDEVMMEVSMAPPPPAPAQKKTQHHHQQQQVSELTVVASPTTVHSPEDPLTATLPRGVQGAAWTLLPAVSDYSLKERDASTAAVVPGVWREYYQSCFDVIKATGLEMKNEQYLTGKS